MKTTLAACILAIALVVPAFAQDGAKKGSDGDEAFMTGIRKLGVRYPQAWRDVWSSLHLLLGNGAAASRPERYRPRNSGEPAFWTASCVHLQRLVRLRDGA